MSTLQRFKGAAFGLGVTLVPLAALACVQFMLARYTVTAVFNADPAIAERFIASFQRELVNFYAVVTLIVAAYWLLVAALGRGQVLRIKSANIVLALSILTFALLMVIASTVSRPERLFKGACPVLGLSDEQPTQGLDGYYVFDGQSPCEAFARGDAPTVLLVGLPIILLITSAILRIVVSRRR